MNARSEHVDGQAYLHREIWFYFEETCDLCHPNTCPKLGDDLIEPGEFVRKARDDTPIRVRLREIFILVERPIIVVGRSGPAMEITCSTSGDSGGVLCRDGEDTARLGTQFPQGTHLACKMVMLVSV